MSIKISADDKRNLLRVLDLSTGAPEPDFDELLCMIQIYAESRKPAPPPTAIRKELKRFVDSAHGVCSILDYPDSDQSPQQACRVLLEDELGQQMLAVHKARMRGDVDASPFKDVIEALRTLTYLAARAALRKQRFRQGGAPRNEFVTRAVLLLAGWYQRTTGKPPTAGEDRPFAEMIVACFRIAGHDIVSAAPYIQEARKQPAWPGTKPTGQSHDGQARRNQTPTPPTARKRKKQG